MDCVYGRSHFSGPGKYKKTSLNVTISTIFLLHFTITSQCFLIRVCELSLANLSSLSRIAFYYLWCSIVNYICASALAMQCLLYVSLVPRLHPSAREKGLGDLHEFLYVLTQLMLVLSCDKHMHMPSAARLRYSPRKCQRPYRVVSETT